MRKAVSLAASAVCIVGGVAAQDAGQPAGARNCPIPATAPALYTRLHQIPTTPDPGDPQHTVITPGGMVLETPKMVAAEDMLQVAARDADTLCFTLITFARDWHTCQLSGVAVSASEHEYVFREASAVLHFRLSNDGAIDVTPEGEGYRSHCEPRGRIDPAQFTIEAHLSPSDAPRKLAPRSRDTP